MRFCIIYKEEYPWDVRIEKLAKTLSLKGHDVAILARNLSQDKKSEVIDSYTVNRLPNTRHFPLCLQRVFNTALFFNPIWLYSMYKATAGKTVPILIVRDLPLMFAGILIAKIRKTKIIFDMAECYPEMYASMHQFSKQPFWKTFICRPRILKVYEKNACKLSDHIFVMIQESKKRLEDSGIHSNKISMVSNTPQLNDICDYTVKHDGMYLRIVYVGFITKLRGLDLLVRAVDKFIKMGGDPSCIQVDIIGKGSEEYRLRDIVNKLKLNSNVNIHGWLSKGKVDAILKKANVGALTYRVCPHWNTTIPNKIFDYMRIGLPVIATEVVPIKRILQETGAGVICRDYDINDIAIKLFELRDPQIRKTMGNNGRRAVKDKYNWNEDSSRMALAIEHMVES